MSSDKAPQGEGLLGGIISLFWNKKATPNPANTAPASTGDPVKSHDYVVWSDNVIKKSGELIGALDDVSTPSQRLVSLMGELETILQTDHDSSALRGPNDTRVATSLLALGFALLHLLSTSKIQQEMTLGLKILARILPRAEFDILQPMTQSGLYRWTPDQQRRARQYRSLLVKIQIMIAQKLQDVPIEGPEASIVALPQSVALYPRLLAILYWRLPYVGVLMRKAIGLNLPSLDKLHDFSIRPELPAASVPATTKSGGIPKRGRVKADSKAPPPLNASRPPPMVINTASSSSSPVSTTQTDTTTTPQSTQTTSEAAPSSASPPPVTSPTIETTNASKSSDTTSSASSPSSDQTDKSTASGISSPPPESTDLDHSSSPPLEIPKNGEPIARTSSPPMAREAAEAIEALRLAAAAADLSAPPSADALIRAQSSPASTSTNSTFPTPVQPSPSKSNPKLLTRRPGANAAAMSAPVAAAKVNFTYKVQLTPTSIELDDDLMEFIVLPKIGEVPMHAPVTDPSIASMHPHTIAWGSWLRICKRLGITANDGAPMAQEPPTSAPKSKKEKNHLKSSSSTTPNGNASSSTGSSLSSSASSSNLQSSSSASSGLNSSQTVPKVAQGVESNVGARALLYNWINFHQTLVHLGPEPFPSPGCIASPAYLVEQEPRIAWLSWFEKGRSVLFALFFKEFVNHTTFMLARTNELQGVDWASIPGYKVMEFAMLAVFQPMVTARLSWLLLDTMRPIVRCNPDSLTWFIKYCFNQTHALSTESLNGMFSKLEMWFSELDRNLLRVPLSFDTDYFVAGLDLIIQADHHLMLARLLTFMYTYAHMFRGKVRRAIVEEFLVKKHFFTLFLHWDDVVRNYYQQFLIYKTVRIRKLPQLRHELVPPTAQALEDNMKACVSNHWQVNRRSTYGSINTQAAGAATNQDNLHGPTIQPLLSATFMAGLDSEGFLVDPTDEEYFQDMRLFTVTESLVRIVEDQLQSTSHLTNGPESQTAYPKSLEVYAPRALADYHFYLSRYEQKYMCAKLVPLNMLDKDDRRPAPRGSVSSRSGD